MPTYKIGLIQSRGLVAAYDDTRAQIWAKVNVAVTKAISRCLIVA